MSMGLLLDTDVIVDYLRGHEAALAYIDTLQARPSLSVVVVAELYAGIREGEERSRLEILLKNANIIPLNEPTAVEGGLLRRQYAKSHNIGLADALIAATAISFQLQVVTLNKRYFPMLNDVIVPYLK